MFKNNKIFGKLCKNNETPNLNEKIHEMTLIRNNELGILLRIDLKKDLEKIHVNCRSIDKNNLKPYNVKRREKKETKKDETEKKESSKAEATEVQTITVCIKLTK
jgi:hypothetical protein